MEVRKIKVRPVLLDGHLEQIWRWWLVHPLS
jgi:hypothetical protein